MGYKYDRGYEWAKRDLAMGREPRESLMNARTWEAMGYRDAVLDAKKGAK